MRRSQVIDQCSKCQASQALLRSCYVWLRCRYSDVSCYGSHISVIHCVARQVSSHRSIRSYYCIGHMRHRYACDLQSMNDLKNDLKVGRWVVALREFPELGVGGWDVFLEFRRDVLLDEHEHEHEYPGWAIPRTGNSMLKYPSHDPRRYPPINIRKVIGGTSKLRRPLAAQSMLCLWQCKYKRAPCQTIWWRRDQSSDEMSSL